MKYFRYLTSTCFIIIICKQFILSPAFGQDILTSVTASFNQYHQNLLREKIFVHTDKNFYVAGEIAWFKLYVVNAGDHKPVQLSKVAYVEVTDSANKAILQAKIALNNAEGDGSFYLPPTITSGNYKLRAYTNWMKNFSADYFFEKNITIINVQRSDGIKAKTVNAPLIQLFPEGGNLVSGLTSKVAFKTTDSYGKDIAFAGALLDNKDTLLTFKPVHNGMGSFTFTPLANHLYKAYVRTISGESKLIDLPETYASGYVMSLTNVNDKMNVTVQSTDLNDQTIYLFAHTRDKIKVTQATSLQNGKAVFIIGKAALDDGITSITIFNNKKQPVCERLYFKKPAKQLTIKVNADQQSYTSRKKVSLTISVDSSLLKDSASLSMSVYRLDSLQGFTTVSIGSYLLLTSDIKGYVEDPDQYFLKDDAETNTALDLIMLTNGWRRFKWEDVFKNAQPYFEYVPEYNGAIVTAKIINTITGAPAENIESFMGVMRFPSKLNTSISNKEGRIGFELKNFYGSSSVILQPNTSQDSIYRIDADDPFSHNFSEKPLPEFILRKNAANTLREQSISMQVQNIYSAKKIKQFSVPVADTVMFYKKPEAKYNLDDYTRFTTMEEVLREYVVMVDVRKREGNFHLIAYDIANASMFKSDPLILLDGVPVFDINKFMLTDPLKLYKLEVVNRKYFMGQSVFSGILNWTSYKEDMADYDPGTHATIIDYDGLQQHREFYAPDYTSASLQTGHLPDFRNVLLWKPEIKIATGQSNTISFYTSDLPGKYAVTLQGITKNGLFGSSVATFIVGDK